MFRNPSDAPGIKTINCLLADNGCGDHICALVAIDYIMKTYSYINLLIWVPDYLVEFAKHVLPKGAIVRSYSEAVKKYDDKRIGISTHIHKHTPMRVHPVDYAFHFLADEHVELSKKNYLQIRPNEINLRKFNLPEKYVAIAATAAEKVKTMPDNTINEIAQYIKDKGYVPVFIGKSSETDVGINNLKMQAKAANIKYELGLDLLNKTSVLQTAGVIAGAKAFVGMDGGPVHMAGCTEVPIVCGYTFIDGKKHNIPIRHNELGWNSYIVEPDETLKCRFCQTTGNFLYSHDFRNCYYKDYKCLSYMTSNKFINYLDKIL